MTEEEMLHAFEKVCSLTTEMRLAACAEQWDRLILLERERRPWLDALIAREATGALTPRLRERKLELIEQVLAEDAEIRRRVEPQLAELEQLLGIARTGRRLRERYGAR
jgi:flagellar protein FliT